MKKIVLLLAVIAFASSAMATEPLLLDALPEAAVNTPQLDQNGNVIQNAITNETYRNADGTYEATFTPSYPANMVPQNPAAEGKPVPEKQLPRVKIETKQGRQSNTQWNPGGKGTKSFF